MTNIWYPVHQIKDVNSYYYHFDKSSNSGFLIFYSNGKGILILDWLSFDVVFEMPINVEYLSCSIINNVAFFSIVNTLFEWNFQELSMKRICRTNEKYIGVLSGGLFGVGTTNSRKPMISRKEIFRLSDCEIIYRWNEKFVGILIANDDIFVFNDRQQNNILKRIDIKQNIELWKIELPSRALYYQPITKELFLVSQSFKTDHPVHERHELWGINPETGEIKYKSQDDHEDLYLFSKEKNKLYIISGSIYRAVDPFTGRVLRKIKIAGLEKLWANYGRQSIDGDYIYFAISSRAMVGCFNVETEQLEELIEIEVDETEVDMSEPLETPYVHDGMMYVKDNSGVLHVLKKNQPA